MNIRIEDLKAEAPVRHYIKALEQKVMELEDAAKKVTGWNIPTAYQDEHDDAGHCPYCKGWNMNHKDGCEIYALGKLIGNTPEFNPPQEEKV